MTDIESFYQQKVKEAKEAALQMESQGIIVDYRDLLDAKDILFEYSQLADGEQADDAFGDGDPSQWTY